jgi:hypothetical protein
MESSDVLTVSALIAGFSASTLVFRIQRELSIAESSPRQPTWLPLADWLTILATLVSIVGGVIPLLLDSSPSDLALRIARAACLASAVLLAGYIPSILAHYEFFRRRTESRPFAPALERLFAGIAIAIAACLALDVLRE